MTLFLLGVFALECGLLIAWGLRQGPRVYQFPFLAGATFATFALPQAFALANELDLPPGALDHLLFVSILCAGMCYLGYVAYPHPMKALSWEFDENRLLIVAWVLSGIGCLFYLLIRRLPPEMTGASQWSGTPVSYLFFVRLGAYGFALAVLIFFRTGRKAALVLILFNSVLYFERIVIQARRTETVEFGLCLLLGLWFGRRWIPSRWVMLAAVLLGVLPLYAISAYRAAVYQGKAYGTTLEEGIDWREVVNVDYLESIRDGLENQSHEMRNALYHIHAKKKTGSFNFGVSFWNKLIFTYVPAQIFGPELKASLMVDLPEDVDLFGYEEHIGSTVTGMSDTFEAFSYLGCLVFFLIALILRQLYEASIRGQLMPQLLYVLVIASALLSITHHSMWFFLPWVHMLVLLFPFLWWARIRGTPKVGPAAGVGFSLRKM